MIVAWRPGDRGTSWGLFAMQKWPEHGLDFYTGIREFEVADAGPNLEPLLVNLGRLSLDTGRRLVATLTTLILALLGLTSAFAGEPAPPAGGGFDLRPALDSALQSALLESAPEPDAMWKERHERATTLLMSSAMAASGSSGSTAEARPSGTPGDWLVGDFDTTSKWVTGGLLVGLGAYLGFADEEDVRDLGDITQLIPAATALGFTIGTKDWQGLKQFGLAGGTAMLATHGIKSLVEKSRPDDSATNSYPSGHTSASVTGAAFIWRRYGPKWGAPASVLAAYTGLSRVAGQKHFMDDVISGASIGLISNWLWTDPIDERVKMALFPTDGGVGVNVEVDPTAPRRRGVDLTDFDTIPTRTFLWEIGFADVTRNDVRAPSDSGTTIDWRFDGENNPTATALVLVSWSTRDRKHNLSLGFVPFEVREVFEVAQDLDFAGDTVEAGTEVQSRYLAYDYRVGYGYAVVNKPRFGLTLGGAVAGLDTLVSLSTKDETGDTIETSESAVVFRPQLGLDVDWALAKRWLLFGSYYWWSDSGVEFKDGTVQLAYRLHTKWALSLGYRRVDRKVDVDELYNDADRNQIALGVWYMW